MHKIKSFVFDLDGIISHAEMIPNALVIKGSVKNSYVDPRMLEMLALLSLEINLFVNTARSEAYIQDFKHHFRKYKVRIDGWILEHGAVVLNKPEWTETVLKDINLEQIHNQISKVVIENHFPIDLDYYYHEHKGFLLYSGKGKFLAEHFISSVQKILKDNFRILAGSRKIAIIPKYADKYLAFIHNFGQSNEISFAAGDSIDDLTLLKHAHLPLTLAGASEIVKDYVKTRGGYISLGTGHAGIKELISTVHKRIVTPKSDLLFIRKLGRDLNFGKNIILEVSMRDWGGEIKALRALLKAFINIIPFARWRLNFRQERLGIENLKSFNAITDKLEKYLYLPDENLPDENLPDENLPDGNLPDGNLPDGNLPDGNLPDGNLPDGNLPDGNLPDGDLSGGDLSGGDLSGGNLPDRNLSDGTLSNKHLPDGKIRFSAPGVPQSPLFQGKSNVTLLLFDHPDDLKQWYDLAMSRLITRHPEIPDTWLVNPMFLKISDPERIVQNTNSPLFPCSKVMMAANIVDQTDIDIAVSGYLRLKPHVDTLIIAPRVITNKTRNLLIYNAVQHMDVNYYSKLKQHDNQHGSQHINQHINQHDNQTDKPEVLIVDTYGDLPKLYQNCLVTYLGGGFDHRKRGFDPMESLFVNVPVILGPVYDFNRTAVESLKGTGLIHVLQSQKTALEDFVMHAHKIIINPPDMTPLNHFMEKRSQDPMLIVTEILAAIVNICFNEYLIEKK